METPSDRTPPTKDKLRTSPSNVSQSALTSYVLASHSPQLKKAGSLAKPSIFPDKKRKHFGPDTIYRFFCLHMVHSPDVTWKGPAKSLLPASPQFTPAIAGSFVWPRSADPSEAEPRVVPTTDGWPGSVSPRKQMSGCPGQLLQSIRGQSSKKCSHKPQGCSLRLPPLPHKDRDEERTKMMVPPGGLFAFQQAKIK